MRSIIVSLNTVVMFKLSDWIEDALDLAKHVFVEKNPIMYKANVFGYIPPKFEIVASKAIR